MKRDLSRRELLAAGTAAGVALAIDRTGAAAARSELRVVERRDFAAGGWGRWHTTNVANLRREGEEGVLEAGSDVFPNDPRPVAFVPDRRTRDAEITATITRLGAAAGVVLRRTSPTTYYAAIYDTDRGALRVLRRSGFELDELASRGVASAETPVTLTFSATGAGSTILRAELVDAAGTRTELSVRDASTHLQRAGDAGVLATADTLFPSDPNPVLPALGNLHLLPWAVQEGQAFIATPPGQAIVDEIKRRSTVAFRDITVRAAGRTARSRAAVVAATTGRPLAGGAELHVASDLPADVAIEISRSARFRRVRTVELGRTGAFDGAAKAVRGLPAGRRVYWRPVLTRRGRTTRGPVRSFRPPPTKDARRPYRLAVAACGAQFGPIFELLAAHRPDAFVWQGDLNYPDTHGPLAQTMTGYAGIWREFLANPVLAPVLRRAAFAPQRDDHDYAIQDANSTNIARYPWALAPWRALMNRRTYYRFAAGPAEIWVLDQRRFKTDPTAPDSPRKTLLGERQRQWLLDTLARSRARFKVVCSPCTVFMSANARDGNWATRFTAERDLILDHVASRVRGTTLFLTGDTHLTGVYDSNEHFEARAAPVGIPKPNDITLLDPTAAQNLRERPGVVYADDSCHLTLLEVRGGATPTLDLTLLREDGALPYAKRFA